EGHAEDARDSADAAALDAEAARSAADTAEQAAKDARDAADHAATEAAAAEEAAKDAQKYAESAQQAAEQAEKEANAEQIDKGTVVDQAGAPIGDVFYVVDHIEKIGEPEVVKQSDGCEGWIDELFYNGDCTMTTKLRYKEVVDLYLCTAEDLDTTQYMCPSGATLYLGEYTSDELSTEVTHTITIAEYQKGVDPVDILFGSWIRCAQKIAPGGASGSWGGCAWAGVDVASLFAGKILRPIADAVTALDASVKTGIGFADAWKGLRTVGLTEEAIAGVGARALHEMGETCKVSRITLTVRAAGGYCAWLELGGPGKWMPERESMSQADRAYEQLVTNGVPAGVSYKVPAETKSGYVKFDGYQNGTLIDAKNIHYKDDWINSEGRLKFPTSETRTMVKQVKAAEGTPVVWYMSDEKTRAALELWALDNKVKGIKFVFRQGHAQ
ncbi:Tox-REase-5 domain-containing protein, partial [Streptomyces anthocyanicus]